jgi:hypothetical protein
MLTAGQDPSGWTSPLADGRTARTTLPLLTAWASRAALDAHTSSAAQAAFRGQLGPMAGALYDERPYKLLD